jgi:hypothetical protein
VSLAELTSFWGLCLAQGAIVLLPGVVRGRRLAAVRRRWLLFAAPVAAVIGVTFVPAVAAGLASVLSLLALIAVPPLAALGIAWGVRSPDPRLLPLVPLLLLVAWSIPMSALGEAAALLLVALSCAAVAVAVVAVLPSAVVKVGILLWAAADLSSALAHVLVGSSGAISHAVPAVAPDLLRLQLQRVVIGQSSMEYADLFIAALLGALLAAGARRRGLAALLVAILAMSLAPFFLVTDVVPGTVPVALTLLVTGRRSWLQRASHPALAEAGAGPPPRHGSVRRSPSGAATP